MVLMVTSLIFSNMPTLTAQTKSTAPDFYRGIYLVYNSGKEVDKLTYFIGEAKKSNVNVFVVDVQPAKNNVCPISKENVQLMISNNIYPVARVVCFDQGLKVYPVPQEKIEKLLQIAESAAANGFREIQFDYIRFHDSNAAKITLEQKYTFIGNFLTQARTRLAKYDVKIAADIFGRIPLNKNDIIGQNMEVFDKLVDVICPMAYPSHYTWSEKMMKEPYYTVNVTSVRAKERAKQAYIVTYIQAFQIKVAYSGLTYDKYVEDQIRAVHDSGIRGYILWNARQDYKVPFEVMKNYYKATAKN